MISCRNALVDITFQSVLLCGTTAFRARRDECLKTTFLISLKLKIPSGADQSDCSTKKKACPNCTCGRAEVEKALGEDEARKRLEEGVVKSSCGSVSQLI